MASLTSDLDLLDDEEEVNTPPSLSDSELPDFGNIFDDQADLDESARNFVPSQFLKTANDNSRIADSVLSGAKGRFDPIMEGMAKFRDDLDNHVAEVPPESRIPFYSGQKIEDPDGFMREVDANFDQWADEQDDWFGSDRAKRGMELKGSWDGWKSKFDKAKRDMDTATELARKHREVKDRLSVQYLSVGESKRQALQDIYDLKNPDKRISRSAGSRLSALSGFDATAFTDEASPYAATVARRRKRVHEQLAYDAARKREYEIAHALDKQGITFSKDGYFAGRPLNVNKQEHGVLAELDDSGKDMAVQKYGLDTVENAEAAQAFFHSMIDLRDSRYELMRAAAKKDDKAIKEAKAGLMVHQAAFSQKVLDAQDMGLLNNFRGRLKSEDEINLLGATMHQISTSEEAKDETGFWGRMFNAAARGLTGAELSETKFNYSIGLGGSSREFAEKVAALQTEDATRAAPMEWGEIEDTFDALTFTSELATTIGVQMAANATEGAIAGAGTVGVGAVLEKIGKSKGLKRFPLLRGAALVLGKTLKSKPAFAAGAGFGLSSHMEIGGSYLEALGEVRTEEFPEGVNPLDVEMHMRALQSPEVINQVNRASYGRSVAVGAVDAMTFGAASISSQFVRRAVGKGVGSTALPALARVGTDAVTGASSEVAGMFVMHQTMGMEGPFVTINRGKDGWEVGGYVGDNIEDVIMEAAAGTVVDAYQGAAGKAYEFTGKHLNEIKENRRKVRTDTNFQNQLEKLAEEAVEAEKGTASTHQGKQLVVSEEASEHGTTGVLDTGRGKKHDFYTFKDNTAFLGILTDRFGGDAVNTRQFQFLESFFDQMEQVAATVAGKTTNNWNEMKIVFTSEMEDHIKDSPAAFDPASNTLFLNTSEEFGKSNFGEVTSQVSADGKEVHGLVANIVHEIGHFTESYVVGDAKVKSMFESIDANKKGADGTNQGMFESWVTYDLPTRGRAEQSPEAWKAEREAFYKQYREDDRFADTVKSEWYAFQFSRVARDKAEGMDGTMLGFFKRMLNVIRTPYNDMIGDKKLSNKEIDADIAAIFARDEVDATVGLSQSERAEANRLRTTDAVEPVAEGKETEKAPVPDKTSPQADPTDVATVEPEERGTISEDADQKLHAIVQAVEKTSKKKDVSLEVEENKVTARINKKLYQWSEESEDWIPDREFRREKALAIVTRAHAESDPEKARALADPTYKPKGTENVNAAIDKTMEYIDRYWRLAKGAHSISGLEGYPSTKFVWNPEKRDFEEKQTTLATGPAPLPSGAAATQTLTKEQEKSAEALEKVTKAHEERKKQPQTVPVGNLQRLPTGALARIVRSEHVTSEQKDAALSTLKDRGADKLDTHKVNKLVTQLEKEARGEALPPGTSEKVTEESTEAVQEIARTNEIRDKTAKRHRSKVDELADLAPDKLAQVETTNSGGYKVSSLNKVLTAARKEKKDADPRSHANQTHTKGEQKRVDAAKKRVDAAKKRQSAKPKKDNKGGQLELPLGTRGTRDLAGVRQVFSEKKSAQIKTLASKSLPDRLRKKLAEAPSSKTEAEVLGKEVWERYLAQAAAKIDRVAQMNSGFLDNSNRLEDKVRGAAFDKLVREYAATGKNSFSVKYSSGLDRGSDGISEVDGVEYVYDTQEKKWVKHTRPDVAGARGVSLNEVLEAEPDPEYARNLSPLMKRRLRSYQEFILNAERREYHYMTTRGWIRLVAEPKTVKGVIQDTGWVYSSDPVDFADDRYFNDYEDSDAFERARKRYEKAALKHRTPLDKDSDLFKEGKEFELRGDVFDAVHRMSEQWLAQKAEQSEVAKSRRAMAEGDSKLLGARVFHDRTVTKAKEVARKVAPGRAVKKVRKLNHEKSKKIADAFDAMEHDPNDPKVAKAYAALAEETVQQFDAMVESGVTVEVYQGAGEPYANSREMIDDLEDNNHFYVLSTEQDFGQTAITDDMRTENPLLKDSGRKDVNGQRLLINDLFRLVHDFFGHGELGNGFGPVGEENAWVVHSRMFSKDARRAMTTETRGQNSWVNFNQKLRRLDGSLPTPKDSDYVPLSEREFGEQKLGLLPDQIVFDEGGTKWKVYSAKGARSTGSKVQGSREQKETGYRSTKGKDVLGRDIPEWGGAVVAHSTDTEGLRNISAEGYRAVGDGYYGRAVSFTIDKEYSKQFGKHLTVAEIAEDVKILNLNDEADWDKFIKLTGGRFDGRDVHDKILKGGYDGVYDAGAGDLFLHNPRKATLLGSRGVLGSNTDGSIDYAEQGDLSSMFHRDSKGTGWRYREDEQSLFFWSEPTEADLASVKGHLAKLGFSVKKMRVLNWMDAFSDDFREAHGQKMKKDPDDHTPSFYDRDKQKGRGQEFNEDAFRAFAENVTRHPFPKGARSVVWSPYDALEYNKRQSGDTSERLRLKQNRRKDTGVAKNENLTFNDARGRTIHIGADMEHGGKPFEAWVKETTDWLTDAEIDDFSNWYKEISGQFTKVFGEEGVNIMVAWLSAQQNVSPVGAMANVFKVQDLLDDVLYEKQTGGLAHDKIVAVLTETAADKGFAGKLTDFVDAGFGKKTRTYMGDDPSAGQPFVADIHTGVDSGHVNHQTLTRLMKMADKGQLFVGNDRVEYELLGTKVLKTKRQDGSYKEKTVPTSVKFRVGGEVRTVKVDQQTSPSKNVYEGISEWGNNLTSYLNDIGWKGKSWDASMAQAVGWMRVLKAYGLPMGDSMSAITQNTSSVYAETNYSSGNRLRQAFPPLVDEKGTTSASRRITNFTIPRIAAKVAAAVGGSLRIRGTTPGTGVWGGELADMIGIEMLGSENIRKIATYALAWVTEQGGAIGVVFGKGGKDKRAVTFERADGRSLTDKQRRSLADHLNSLDIAGYGGGLSVARLNGQREGVVSGLNAVQAEAVMDAVLDWATKNKVKLVGNDVASESNYYELEEGETFQDKPGGLGYLHEIERLGGASKIPAILGLLQEYALLLEEAHQRYGPEQLAGSKEERLKVAGTLPKRGLGKFKRLAEDANLPMGARTTVAPINVFDMAPEVDVMGHHSRVMGARPGEVAAHLKMGTQAAVSASAQILLDDSITFVERLGQLGDALTGLVTDPIRVKLQDKLLPVRRLLETMEDEKGETLDDKYQTYVKHENHSGMTGSELFNWSERHERPLAEKVAETGVDMSALDDYLHIRHARERNEVDRNLHMRHTVYYRHQGRAKKRTFKGHNAKQKAVEFTKGYIVTWDNTDQHGNVTTNSREITKKEQAERLVKRLKNRKPRASGVPYHTNVTQTYTKLSSRNIVSKSKVEAGSGYSDEVADAALRLDRAQLHRLNAQGKLDDDGLARMDRMIDAMRANPGGQRAYETVAKMVDKMNRESLARQHKSGLIGDKDFKRLKNAYRHYVPLRGWDEVSLYYDASNADVQQLLENKIAPISRGVNTIKHAFKGSTGLKEGTAVANHLAYSMAMARQGIVESNKNEVMRSFFELIHMARKDKKLGSMAANFFTFNTIPKITTVVNGVPRKGIDPKWKDDPNVIGMKINGRTEAIRLMPDRPDGTSSVARALKNLGAEKTSTFVNFVKGYTRFMAAMRTTFSPAFTAVNFVRDIGTAYYAIKGFEADFKRAVEKGEISEKDVAGISDKTVKSVLNARNLRKALQGALHHSTGGRGLKATQFIPGIRKVGQKARQDPEVLKWAAVFKDFSDNGGRINFFGFDTVQDMAKKFGVAVKDFDPTNENLFKNFVKNAAEVMEQTSGAVENLSRVIVYDSLVKSGISKQRAANMSLNLTTNFTRKGEWTTALNAMYLFFNAGVQGSYKIVSVAGKSARARHLLAGMVGIGFTQAVINRLFSDDDEETGESAWDRISPHSKTHNLHLFLPGTGEAHAKLPSPYGLNVFTSMGTMAADVMFGKTRLGDAAATLAATAMESFSPIGGSSMASAITPTAIQPFTDLMRNRDFAGRPIYKENMSVGPQYPDSSLYYSNVTGISKMTAKTLNKVFGGDDFRAGWVDMSPEVMDYMGNYFLGGLGSFLGRSMDGVGKMFVPGEPWPEVNDVPIFRRFVGGKTVWSDTDRFYRLVTHIGVSKKRVEGYQKAGDHDALREVRAYESPRLRMKKLWDGTVMKQLSGIRKQLVELEGSKRLSGRQKQRQIEVLKDRRAKIMNNFVVRAERLGIDDY